MTEDEFSKYKSSRAIRGYFARRAKVLQYKLHTLICRGIIHEAIVYMAHAQEESAMKSQRLKKAWEGKRKGFATQKLTAYTRPGFA